MEPMSSEVTPQHQTSVDVKLDYIQRDIREIKGDVSLMKNDFVSRREFTEALNSLKAEIVLLKSIEAAPTFWGRNQDKIIWGAVGIVLMLFYFLLKKNGFPDFLS